jgi:iron only hydrogenase large subunit-like protein
VVISISPQTRASLAVHYGLNAAQTLRRLITLFKSLGADYVFDTSFSREFTLLESMGEFIARHKSGGALPVLASACPGWICYAEKTHGIGSHLLRWRTHTHREREWTTERVYVACLMCYR